MGETVKICTCCGANFTLQDLLHHGEIRPIGMVLRTDTDEHNYYFNHECLHCRTTFTVPIDAFSRLIAEPIPSGALEGHEGCNNHCVRLGDLQRCDQPCSHAPFRRFLIDVLCRRDRAHLPVVYDQEQGQASPRPAGTLG